jgi:transcriptional regulator with XRE-family HTH domain
MSAQNVPLSAIAREIRAKRKALNWSASELARQARVSVATVSLTERDRTTPDPETLRKIREALDNGQPKDRGESLLPRKKLKRRRKTLGLTCKQLGALAEPRLDGSTVACIERGRSVPTVETARALLAALDRAEAERPAVDPLVPEMIHPRRLDLGWTLDQLAERAEVCGRTIWEIEQGQCKPRRATLEAIDRALRAGESQPQVDVGAEVRDRRVKAGLRLEDLAKRAKVGRNTLFCIETGKSKPKQRTLKKVSAALDTAAVITPAEQVQERRLALRLTQEELVKEARISLTILSRIENGHPCEVTTLRKLDKAFERLGGTAPGEPQASEDGKPESPLPSGPDIRQERLAVGLSQVELAQRAGISQQALWFIEKGKTTPMVPTVRRIEEVLKAARDGTLGDNGRRSVSLYPKASKAAKDRWKKVRANQDQGTNGSAKEPNVPDKPRWDGVAQTLWFGEVLVRRYDRGKGNQVVLLQAFEQAGWPQTIPSPLDRETLAQTVKDLNRTLKGAPIRFGRDGKGKLASWRRR